MKTISVRVDDELYATLVAEADGRPLGAYLLRLAREVRETLSPAVTAGQAVASIARGPINPAFRTPSPVVTVHQLPTGDARRPVEKPTRSKPEKLPAVVERPADDDGFLAVPDPDFQEV